MLVAGIAGLVAGAMSMAAGEYVSVSSQADTEKADLERERRELGDAAGRRARGTRARYTSGAGSSRELARQVAEQLMAKDALAAHARDELGISEATTARPIQAALTSAAAFSVGAAMPLAWSLVVAAAMLVPRSFPRHRFCSSRCWARSARRPAAPTCDSRRPGDVLGRARDGFHRRHRRPGRHGHLRSTRGTALQHHRGARSVSEGI